MKLLNILQVKQEAYENMRFETYMTWCLALSTNNQQYQTYLANSAINRWYNKEYERLEKEFFKTMYFKSKLDTVSLRMYYADVTNKIFEIYPSALLKVVKVKKPNNKKEFNLN